MNGIYKIFSNSQKPTKGSLLRKWSDYPMRYQKKLWTLGGASLKASQREETVEKQSVEERLAVGMSQLRG